MIDNPYWELVRDWVAEESYPGRGRGLVVGDPFHRKDEDLAARYKVLGRREDLVRQYAWSITDPGTLDFILKHAPGPILDPMAGSGYWAWLFVQSGREVMAFDRTPPPDHEYYKTAYWAVEKGTGAEVAGLYGLAHTLFLSWPPYATSDGYETVRGYSGNKVILVGEGESGCTGDDKMFQLLDDEWTYVKGHRPIQWWGLHDYVSVYERKA